MKTKTKVVVVDSNKVNGRTKEVKMIVLKKIHLNQILPCFIALKV